jgi:hypothetical protein
MVLVSSDGEVLDRRLAPHRGVAGWTPDGTGIVLFEVGAVREDDLIRHDVTADGFGERRRLRGGIPTDYSGEMDVALATGDVVYVQGAGASALHFVDLTDPDRASRRFAAGSTWYGTPGAYDGSTILYQRGDAIGDNIYRYDVATGVEIALTEEPTAGGNPVRFSADGTRAVYDRVSSTAEAAIGIIELPSGLHQLSDQDGSITGLTPVGTTGLVGLEQVAGRMALRWLDAPDGTAVTIPADLPDGRPAPIWGYAVSPDESTLSVVAMIDGDAVLGLLPLGGGEIEVLTTLTLGGGEDLVGPGVLWVRDGIRVVRWVAGDESPSVWAWSNDGGTLTRIFDVPLPCNNARAVDIDPTSSLMVCMADDAKTDLFILPGYGR